VAVETLSDPAGIAALAAGGVALLSLILTLVLAFRIRRLRHEQRAVLGPAGREDLVSHASSLQEAFSALHGRVEEVAERLDARMSAAEERLDGAIAYRSLVRYDAYGELSGHQSTSIALLDAGHSGVVLSAIVNREFARLYCKQVHAGEGELELSPEEAEAVRLALAGEVESVTLETPVSPPRGRLRGRAGRR
jgi:uncharacterized protein DUF4446